jgi:2-polyprenyl-3-methyl-5-hydroxy-6-metoxy-1,4-benzoquinol methylase
VKGLLRHIGQWCTMDETAISYRQQQEKVNAHFQAQTSYWNDIYIGNTVYAEIYRARQAYTLAWIDDLVLAPGSRVLDVGCGAGFLSVELAKRGLRVHAIDSAETMVELTRRHAEESGVTELLSVGIGDVCGLDFEDDSFDLVTALGVTSWLARPELAIREMARVSMPGGHILLTEGNRAALHLLLDPLKNPALAPLRRAVKDKLERAELLHPSPKPMAAVKNPHFIDEALVSTRLIKSRSMTLGFGTFTFFHYKFLPERLGISLHHRLQRLADRNVPFFRSTGMSYLVLATKPTLPPERTMSAEHVLYPKSQ